MKKFLKTFLISSGGYILDSLAKEFKVYENITNKLKTEYTSEIFIYFKQVSGLYNDFNTYLIENHPSKFKTLISNGWSNLGSKSEFNYVDDSELEGKSTIQPQMKFILGDCKSIIKIDNIYVLVEHFHNVEHKGSYFKLTSIGKESNHVVEDFLKTLIINNFNKYTSETDHDIVIYLNFSSDWSIYKTYKPIKPEHITTPIKHELWGDIDEFLSNKDWYKKKNIRFTRKYLIYGAPRNEKTTLIESTAYKYKKNLAYLNLGNIKKESDLITLFMNIPYNSWIVIEDIDTIWNKRESLLDSMDLSFSTFLNILSGVLEQDDLVIFFTTNNITSLDDALKNDRRIDRKFYVDKPSKEQIEQFLSNMYEHPITLKHYYKGRVLAQIFNLYIKYSKDAKGLIELLESEYDDSNFDQIEYVNIKNKIT